MNEPSGEDRMPPRLQRAVSALPETVKPARDLWPGIRAAIDAERVQPLPISPIARPRMVPLRVAVAAMVFVAVSAGGAAWWAQAVRAPVSPTAAVPAERLAAPQASAADPALSFVAYERSAEELARLYAARADRLDPATREVLERSMRTIDAALEDARAALARDPNSEYVRSFVESVWRQKLDFLRRANDVAVLREI